MFESTFNTLIQNFLTINYLLTEQILKLNLIKLFLSNQRHATKIILSLRKKAMTPVTIYYFQDKLNDLYSGKQVLALTVQY